MAGRIQKDVSSSYRFAAVTPSDTVDLPAGVRGLYVGTGGNAVLVGTDGVAVTFSNIASGTVLPVQVNRVNATNTTASGIVALF